MMFKKIFAFTLALLFIAGSAFVVSAETPPYSEGFESEEEMLTALSKYAEEYPNYEGFNFNGYIGKGYHLEYRQVLSVGFGVSDVLPEWYSFSESHYGQGIDTTFTSFNCGNESNAFRVFVNYGYSTDEVLTKLEKAKTDEGVASFDEGTVNGNPYVICEYSTDNEPPRIDYYLAVDEYLIHILSYKEKIDYFLNSVFIEYKDVYIPVRINDNAKWLDETIEKGYIIGDANADGNLNIRDATAVQKYTAKIGEVDKLVADFNGDFKINVKDATEIQKKLAGLKYTCKREQYPVTHSYNNNIEMKPLEATTDYAGPFSNSELALIMDYGGFVKEYNTVFNSVEEFEAFFGKTLERYDEEFFEDNSLVYLYRGYNSSSFRWTPESLEFSDGILHVLCNRNIPSNDYAIENALSNNNLFYEVSKADIQGLKGIWVTERTVEYD